MQYAFRRSNKLIPKLMMDGNSLAMPLGQNQKAVLDSDEMHTIILKRGGMVTIVSTDPSVGRGTLSGWGREAQQ